ncbi:DUF4030 domain-containing protein [Salibacterium salarium]|uniref:DUF4030 domain-containing protein n=1 Tax=Salibacterium salarium TaxID=284579 RepID=A0A3R9RA42_9BACI|nr:DUF4030 domain-containing protein [Salibacterium salarium]RSL30704.1 DUF4030 domain-containing protein [Salibacterium salarium]
MNKSVAGIAIVIVGGIILFSTMAYTEKEQTSAQTEELDMHAVNEELGSLTIKMKEGLNDYEEIGDIKTEYQQSLTVQTSIESTDPNAENAAQNIRKDAENLLKSEEFKTVSNRDSYKIYVENDSGKIIN